MCVTSKVFKHDKNQSLTHIKMTMKREFLFTLLVVSLAVITAVITNASLRSRTSNNSYQTKKGKAAVVANGLECSNIGAMILRSNGSAVDAAIATLLCDGVTCPQSTGLGGGFFMTIYTKATNLLETLDAREVAPLASSEDMFVTNPDSAKLGALSVAVPGELKGYYEAHKKYGKLPWESLLRPVVKLCNEGHIVSYYLAKVLKTRETQILNEPSLREVFINPETNQTWREGDILKRPKLAETLQKIANEGADALYSKNGTLLKTFVDDIKYFGGIITEEDLVSYSVEWGSPDKALLQNGEKELTLHSHGLPGAGSILTLILHIINGYKLDESSLSYHRIIESFKFGYALRTKLADKRFVEGIDELVKNLTDPNYANILRSKIDDTQTFDSYKHYGAEFSAIEDYGTAHISVLAENGDAVSATGTINLIMGAMLRSPSTGIMLNDEMDDFSTPNTINEFGIPASPANFIKPGKKPLSSMVPSILLNKNGSVRLVIGAAGGSKITTSVAYVILHHIFLNQTLDAALKKKRLHHQLVPYHIQYEEGFDENLLEELKMYKHKLQEVSSEAGFAAVVAISIDDDGTISASYDPRRGGSITIID
ncbi:scoloptoxin SSD14-like [Culicoides brevitarsis]|uniref:scoloptoxin SSD14-like n=1 Tax=Culicoides brevitarsis TaxID=469753 RepID=UPI00307C4C74